MKQQGYIFLALKPQGPFMAKCQVHRYPRQSAFGPTKVALTLAFLTPQEFDPFLIQKRNKTESSSERKQNQKLAKRVKID